VLAIVVGTRPEAIKLAPLIHVVVERNELGLHLINSGQHPAAVRHTLAGFGIACDTELSALPALPNVLAASRHLRAALRSALRRIAPSAVLVQGDTLSAYAGARAAHDCTLPVAHVEAGLRTANAADPFPEEWFRRQIARHAQWHFAPCRSALENLRVEGIEAAQVHRVGNTGIDTLRALLERTGIQRGRALTRNVMVTLHRRENWDAKAEIFCDALIDLAARHPDLHIVFPVHPNPRIAKRIRRRLGSHISIQLVDPMEYPEFIRMVAAAALVISDSGGIQEEAPHLGTPLLVPRSNTERPECLATGFVQLVALERERIVEAAGAMLAQPRRAPLPFDDAAPFGAGDASLRIAAVLEHALAGTR
jgi:UDP-N-acetylglucosamine 2-epimerase (non-hydrolysing)